VTENDFLATEYQGGIDLIKLYNPADTCVVVICVDRKHGIAVFRALMMSENAHTRAPHIRDESGNIIKSQMKEVERMSQQRGCLNPGCTEMGLRVCGACRAAKYCSEHCQRLNWPQHKICCASAKILKSSMANIN
jgi:hypothetical protein